MEPFYNKVLRMYTIATQRSSSAEVKDDTYSYTVAVESCTDASSKSKATWSLWLNVAK